MAHRTISVALAVRPDLDVIAYTPYSGAVQELKAAGAATVISADHAATKLVVGEVLNQAGVSDEGRTRILETLGGRFVSGSTPKLVTLSEAQRASGQCSHANSLSAVRAPTEFACPECVALGDSWLHLRICMSCGAVGCCDSSKNKHATAHFNVSRHPVIKSVKKGESWAWCYVDKVTLESGGGS